MIVKEININSEVFYINIIIIIIAEVGGALALIITPYCTRFYTTKFCATSEAINKGIVIYKYNYILSVFNWYWPI